MQPLLDQENRDRRFLSQTAGSVLAAVARVVGPYSKW